MQKKIHKQSDHHFTKEASKSPPAGQPPEVIKKTLQGYAKKLQAGPNDKAAKGILKITPQLTANYEEKLLDNVEQCLKTNVEQELWRACFYAAIEALKKQAGNGGPHSEMFQEFLLEFIDQAINFYEELLQKYECKFGFEIKNVTGDRHYSTTFFQQLDEAIVMDGTALETNKHVLRSAQRHLIYLGDLHRYRVQNQSQNNERKNYSIVKKFYRQAFAMETTNGHPLNQLAVVAGYEKNWIDLLFYYARSLSVPLAFNSARESLEIALNTLRKPAMAFERSIWELAEKSQKKTEKAEKNKIDFDTKGPMMDILANKKDKNAGAKNYEEKWIHPATSGGKGQKEEDGIDKEKWKNLIGELFNNGENAAQNYQKKAIGHLLHCAGILISRIGIENFGRSSKLVLEELKAFILTNDAILNPAKILKIIFLFTFPIHASKAGASKTLMEEQKKTAVEMMFSIFGIFLEIICFDLDKIGLYLLTGRLSKKFSRLLPSFIFLLFWFYKNCAQFQNLRLNIQNGIWQQFCEFYNKLVELRQQGELANCSEEYKLKTFALILPEFFVLSPCFDFLTKQPTQIYISPLEGINIVGKEKQYLAVQGRFGLILEIAEALAKNEEFNFLEMRDGQICAIERQQIVDELPTENNLEENGELLGEKKMAELDFNELVLEEGGDKTMLEPKQIADEYELKRKLLDEEQQSFAHKWMVEVNPKYLVPDTNTFIDYLKEIELLIKSPNSFVLLIPTIVIDELNSLMLGVPIAGLSLLSREILNPKGSQSAYLMEQAKKAMQWLRDAAHQRIANMKTVTSNGNILHLSFAAESAETGKKRSNDDRILSVCVNLCRNLEKAGTTHSLTSADQTQLERIVVLLTEDRGLSAKALAERIPVRTIPNFAKWALRRGKGNEGGTKK